MKKTVLIVLALYGSSIYSDEYIFFQSTGELYSEVEKRSPKICAFIREHDLLHIETKSIQLIQETHELVRISEHELDQYPMLKKRFISDLWVDLAIGRFEAKDFEQAEYFCDLAIATDPENPLPYPQKACFCEKPAMKHKP